MSRFDEFDRMFLRLVNLGVAREKASELADTCRAATSAFGYRQADREQLAIMLPQVFATGVLRGDELRSLRETAPFLDLHENPSEIRPAPAYVEAISKAIALTAAQDKIESVVSGVVARYVGKLKGSA